MLIREVVTFALVAVISLGAASAVPAYGQPASVTEVVRDAESIFQAARRAEAAGDSLNAYLLYVRATALDPGNPVYISQREAMSRQMNRAAFTQVGPDPAALEEFRMTLEGAAPTDVIVSEEALAPPRLEPVAEGSIARRSFDLRGTAELLFEEVGAAYGLVFIFGADYQDPGVFTYRVQNVGWQDALRVLEVASNSFIVPVGGNAALVFRDQQQRRNDQSAVVSVAIPIPERISVQEAQEIASGVQQTMDIQRIAVDAGRRIIFIRDTESNVIGARKVISDLTRYRAQVAIDVELLSVSSNSALSYGLSLPTVAPIFNFSSFLNNLASTALDVATNVATFGAGASLFGIGIADAAGFATLSRSSGQSVIQAQMISLDGQQAIFHLGDRYPIVVGRFGDPSDIANSTPQTQYVDLGLQLDITPVVHEGGEVSLTVDATNSVLAGTAANGIPVISNREMNGTVRLKAGEWAVIAGLTVTSASDRVSGIPVLSQIPWIGKAFRSNTKVEDTGQILIVLKPRLMSSPPWERPTKPLYVGTETTPASIF